MKMNYKLVLLILKEGRSHIHIIANCVSITVLSHDSAFWFWWCIIIKIFDFSVMRLGWWVRTFTNTPSSRPLVHVRLSRWRFFGLLFVHGNASISILRLKLKSIYFLITNQTYIYLHRTLVTKQFSIFVNIADHHADFQRWHMIMLLQLIITREHNIEGA